MFRYKRWNVMIIRIGLLLLLAAMAQDFITGKYSAALLAAGSLLLITGLVANLIEELLRG